MMGEDIQLIDRTTDRAFATIAFHKINKGINIQFISNTRCTFHVAYVDSLFDVLEKKDIKIRNDGSFLINQDCKTVEARRFGNEQKSTNCYTIYDVLNRYMDYNDSVNEEKMTAESKIINHLQLSKKLMIFHFFGDNYYNMGMDIYTCDQFSTEDCLNRYNYQCWQLSGFKKICIGLSFSTIMLLYALILLLK